jgi:hypothetical protein
MKLVLNKTYYVSHHCIAKLYPDKNVIIITSHVGRKKKGKVVPVLNHEGESVNRSQIEVKQL